MIDDIILPRETNGLKKRLCKQQKNQFECIEQHEGKVGERKPMDVSSRSQVRLIRVRWNKKEETQF